MTSTTKRAWRLNEFPAHVGNVNCLAVGHKSGRVMVSGGDDKKVNMWAIGKPTCILSLSGHTSPVDAVKFNSTEDMVIAGSLSGALKIWDLESVKILRTLTGHKSSVRSMDFHPYGNYVATGSTDTNIKLFDMRRRGCIYTYKGHTNCVNFLRFSPDGKWIASAGEDGLIKLWDLSAGKQLAEFRDHTAAAIVVKFHPNEFFLASGSMDRTVKFWDLESMQLVCTTDGDCTPVRTLTFHPDGTWLYCGCENQLKVYGWEPAQCYDSLTTGWSRVSDVAIDEKQLVGASFSQSNVSTFIVDIERVRPLGGTTPVQAYSSIRPQMSTSRRSFAAERPDTRCGSQKPFSSPKEEAEETLTFDETKDDTSSGAVVCDPEKYQEVFQARHRLTHSPVAVEPFPAPVDDGLPATGTAAGISTPTMNATQRVETAADANLSSTQSASARLQNVVASDKNVQQQKKKSAKTVQRGPSSDNIKGRRQTNEIPSDSCVTRPDRDVPTTVSKQRNDVNIDFRTSSQPPRQRLPATDFPQPTDEFGGRMSEPSSLHREQQSSSHVRAEDFLQKLPSTSTVDDDVLSMISSGHKMVKDVLSRRRNNLQLVKAMWSAGNVKTAVESALHMRDEAVMFDVIGLMLNKTSLWNLDLCLLLLPALSELIASRYDSYVSRGLEGLKQILLQFAVIIKANITAPPSASVGVDISREERYNKCMSCYKLLMDVRSKLEERSPLPSAVAPRVRELRLLMGQLD